MEALIIGLMIMARFIIAMSLIALIAFIVGVFIFLCVSCISDLKKDDDDTNK